MSVPARNTSLLLVGREKSSDVAETVTVIFDGRMAKGATRISTDVLTELAASLSFTIVELHRNCTWNSDRFACVFMWGYGVKRKRL